MDQAEFTKVNGSKKEGKGKVLNCLLMEASILACFRIIKPRVRVSTLGKTARYMTPKFNFLYLSNIKKKLNKKNI